MTRRPMRSTLSPAMRVLPDTPAPPAVPAVPAAPAVRRLRRDAQSIAFAVAGAAHGHPVVVLHGGPGSGSQAGILRLFDLTRVRVVLVDQRGAGASAPRGGTRHNSTARLIADLEAVREQLGIARWGVVGGSWGAALALAYAGTHPARVTGVVLRGLFLTSPREVRRLFTTSRTRAPREWRRLACGGRRRPGEATAVALRAAAAPRRERGTPARSGARVARVRKRRPRLGAHAPLACAGDPLGEDRSQADRQIPDPGALPAARLLARRTQLACARASGSAGGVPLFAAHGMHDPVCPAANVVRLARAAPEVVIERVHAGHLASDPALAHSVARAVATMFAAPAFM
ncbi:alpha/beta fold hydrolase [Burkholderia contaminans]|uniref:alpha/beta fold hydrolase n=1 Tax=Burkholderia contaminans TaxID=488447 RepID=UPI0024161333|nr:alpha/beta fold hydrolase [Burkholderia contaminans]WFN13873.1 alpha/beta fold hydrolase [Burkholderia contaminans]